MIKELISKVVGGNDLTESEMERAMDEIMSGQATPAQIGAFITGLRMKGETVEEITGAARTMRAKATKIQVNLEVVSIDRDDINIDDETILDIVGTGGDGTRTFNVSTTTAFVAAGALSSCGDNANNPPPSVTTTTTTSAPAPTTTTAPAVSPTENMPINPPQSGMFTPNVPPPYSTNRNREYPY